MGNELKVRYNVIQLNMRLRMHFTDVAQRYEVPMLYRTEGLPISKLEPCPGGEQSRDIIRPM